jgi:hypothetical protein
MNLFLGGLRVLLVVSSRSLLSIKQTSRKLMSAALKASPKEGSALFGCDRPAYLMPGDYVMQGMIADTGGEFRLHKGLNTFALIKRTGSYTHSST